VENIERFGAEFEFPLAGNFKMFQQGNIEIRTSGIMERISSTIPERQPLRSDEGRRILEQGSETLRVVSFGRRAGIWIRDTVGIGACSKVVAHARGVRNSDPAGTPAIDDAEGRACLKNGDSRE